MSNKSCLAILSALMMITVVSPFPNGAPRTVCVSMMPSHAVEPQNTKPPFRLLVDNLDLTDGSPVKVTLQADSGSEFRGYLIEARAGDSNEALGTFDVKGSKGKTMNCQNGFSNAVTHTTEDLKTNETFLWTPPEGFQGQIKFKSTVVVEFLTFYTNLLSETVNVI